MSGTGPGWTHLRPEDSSEMRISPAAETPVAAVGNQPAPAAVVSPPPGPAGYPSAHGPAMQPQTGHPAPQHAPPAAAPAAPRPQAQPPAGSQAQSGGEELIFDGKARHSAAFGGYLKWMLASVVGGLVAFGLGKIEFFASWPLWLLSLVGIPGMIWTFLQHISTRYKITMRRVEFERGVLSKEVDSLELWRVLDVRFRQNIIDRMLGNATVVLIGTDQTDPELELYGLPNARPLFERLRDAVQAARHTSRPMEMVGHDGMMENVMPPME